MVELINAAGVALERYNSTEVDDGAIVIVDDWMLFCSGNLLVAVYHPNKHFLIFGSRTGVAVSSCMTDPRMNLSALGRLAIRGRLQDGFIVTDWSGSQRALNEFKKHRNVSNNVRLSPDIIEHDKAKRVYYGRILS